MASLGIKDTEDGEEQVMQNEKLIQIDSGSESSSQVEKRNIVNEENEENATEANENEDDDQRTTDQQESSKDSEDEESESEIESIESVVSIPDIEESFHGKPMQCEDLIGKPYLLSSKSLRTVDRSVRSGLLDMYNKACQEPMLNMLHKDCERYQYLLSAKNVLLIEECRSIIDACQKHQLQNMGNWPGYKRKNSRLVVFDKKLSDTLWQRIRSPLKEVFSKENIRLFPLGFNVTKGKWEFSSVNEAMRFNKYESFSSDMFAPHRDAQFCPSGDERSMLSVVIYLNEDFDGGETKFYFPKENHHSKGLTMNEELELNAGLDVGYKSITIKPSVNDAVIFTQNIIHESVPLEKKDVNQMKYIIKTDILLQRCGKNFGFAVSQEEQNDYVECLSLFRMAQQKELSGYSEHIPDSANSLYEKCLSLRYSYPTKHLLSNWDENEVHVNSDDDVNLSQETYNESQSLMLTFSEDSKNAYFRFPFEIWGVIMRELCDKDVVSLVNAFPHLEQVKRTIDSKKIQPQLEEVVGVYSGFVFPFGEFAELNIEACCRVLAVYSVFLLGNPKDTNMYTVRYDEEKNEAVVVELETLLKNVFYGEECYGAIMKVLQQGNEKKPMEDLVGSTDRMFMTTKFNKEFTSGRSIQSEVRFIESIMNQQSNPWSDDKDFSTEYENYRHVDVINYWDKSISLSGVGVDFADSEEEKDRINNMGVDYYYTINKFRNSQYVGAAIVRELPEPVLLDGYNNCLCPIGGFGGEQAISEKCNTCIYNHLVADFNRQKLTVHEHCNNEGGMKCSDCGLLKFLLGYTKEKVKQSKDFRVYSVNITPFQKDGLSFHHANCFCNVPDIRIDEYNNLRSYPYLNHVHIVFTRDGATLKAWTCYGGIAAL